MAWNAATAEPGLWRRGCNGVSDSFLNIRSITDGFPVEPLS